LDPNALARLQENRENFEFVFPDIVKIQAKVKDLNIVLSLSCSFIKFIRD
jgi:hypothetical protein